MMAMTYTRDDVPVSGGYEDSAVLWTGRSGRRYLMTEVQDTRAALAPARLYVLCDAGVIRWVGSAGDLIEDQFSRARFRHLSAGGAQMLSLAAPEDGLARMTLAWDLEGTSHRPERNAA